MNITYKNILKLTDNVHHPEKISKEIENVIKMNEKNFLINYGYYLSKDSIRIVINNNLDYYKLKVIDNYLETYGIETLLFFNEDEEKEITYLNAGDIYNLTIIYIDGNYEINDLGTIWEKYEKMGYFPE
jgi:hypothetical protein